MSALPLGSCIVTASARGFSEGVPSAPASFQTPGRTPQRGGRGAVFGMITIDN